MLDEDFDRLQVLQSLTAKEDWTGARAFARVTPDGWERAETLCRLAKVMARNGHFEIAKEVWLEAIAVAKRGELEANPQESIDCSSVLWEISTDLAEAGETWWAKEVAQNIKSAGKRKRALETLAKIEK
jgi:hypothetical protein